MISLDSSRIKVSNRGEWIKQKWKVRRGWIKVLISIDDKNKQVVGIVSTNEPMSDTKEFDNLVEQSVENIGAAGGVVQANGNGAYDSNDNFKTFEAHDILSTAIKIRGNKGSTCRSKNPRKEYARKFRELG